jgi:hypothetical protein
VAGAANKLGETGRCVRLTIVPGFRWRSIRATARCTSDGTYADFSAKILIKSFPKKSNQVQIFFG